MGSLNAVHGDDGFFMRLVGLIFNELLIVDFFILAFETSSLRGGET